MKFLEKIDTYFYEKESKKEFYYILGLIVLALGFLIFYYILPISKNYYNNAINQYENYISKIQTAKVQLNVLKIKKIQKERKLQTLNKKINELKKEQVFFEELTNLMDFAKFNKTKWASFVKNIIIDAKNEGLKVKLVENKIYLSKNAIKNIPKGMVVKLMSIGLEVKGNYINFIHFIYKYENTKFLLRVTKMKIKNAHDFYVKFTLYGYEK